MGWMRRYDTDGITQLRIMSAADYQTVKAFTRDWITSVIQGQGDQFDPPADLSRYHTWQQASGFPHGSAFVAPARFTTPPKRVERILLGSKTKQALKRIGLSKWEPMDEGMGWLGYRIIRPGAGDGYPMSRKNWGASKGVVSFWVPMFGFGAQYSLKYVTGSHVKEYKSYLPKDSQFTKDELRLSPDEIVETESEYVAPGNALMYSANTLHTENVAAGAKTRINLEFRALPS
jgi:hypothetical protein